MNPYKARKMAKVIAIVIVLAMVATSFSVIFVIPSLFGEDSYTVYAAEKSDISEAELANETKTLQEYLKYIKKNYKDEVTLEMLLEGAFSGSIDILGDPFSVYYKNEEERDTFIESVEGQFSGVGTVMQENDGAFAIVSLVADGPAEKAGVLVADVITHVDGISMEGKTLKDVTDALRGEINTEVEVTINRKGKIINFKLIRDNVKIESVSKEMMENKIGYIRISSFDNDTNLEFDKAKSALLKQGAQKFIIDIRNNPGGYVHTATNTANSIMPRGPILYLEAKGDILETIYADGVEKQYPLVVLVNEGTGSSSEFFAGALKDSKTATIVGTQTYGKGIIQEIIDVNNKGSLKLSTAYVLTPNKTRIDQVGIIPDYVVRNFDPAEKDRLTEIYNAFAPMKEKRKPSRGDVGLNVYGAQQRLSLLGYKVTVNGTMDAETVAAVKGFQRQSNLSPYETLDYTTQKALEIAVKNKISGIDKGTDMQLEKAISLLK